MVPRDDDHDLLVRIDERLTALHDQHVEMVARMDQLHGRVDRLNTTVAAASGTSSGTMRIFLVGAVVVSLLGLVFTVVHALTQ